MFKVGDRVKASDDLMKEDEGVVTRYRWYEDLYNATKNNKEMILKELYSDSVVISCESFTSSSKTWMIERSDLQLYKNDGKLRFTYSEVPPGTEYSNFLAWSRRHK